MSVKAQTSIRMERALQDTARFRTGAMKQYSHLSIITKYLFRLFMSALYWDSEMFGRSTKGRRQMEKGSDTKDYKKELLTMFANMDVFFDTPHKRHIAERYRNFFMQVSTIATAEDFKHIYEGLISGDPKMRTFRALYHRIYGKYISKAKKMEDSKHGQ